jgi:hypothetical protein
MKLYKDRYFLFLSLAAAFVSFVLYYATKAPTVSFWDCGEFIATSYIMGVPHPPGNPMYVILGRFFTLLPIAGDIAVRINLISVISSAASVFMAFWLILRLALNGKPEMPKGLPKIGLGFGAFAGALIMGFSYTFWSNAVEAEVYGPSMLLMMITAYVALIWASNFEKRGNDRLIILITYLLWLSLGIHMTTFILSVPIVLYMAYIDYKKGGLERWPIWVILGLFILYAVPIQTQIFGAIGIDISARELESFFTIIGLVTAGSITMYVSARMRNSSSMKVWGLALLVLTSGAIGYSTQFYIPIRAAQKPAINENDPSNWPRFKGFLERKQYGQESMITRMFARRGSWQNQFVSNPNFGLMRLLSEQFSSPDARLTIAEEKNAPDGNGESFGFSLWIIYVLFFGLTGIMEAYRRSKPDGAFIIFTMLLCTVGLVFYLNFSDGAFNKLIAPIAEVRDRDYFYTPGFMLYGILIGVGLAAFLEWAGGLGMNSSAALRKFSKPIFGAAILIGLVLPLHTTMAGYGRVDRSGNYIPWDYAYNILQSCDRNAILYTNGDNDTFPLWFIQEVEKVRTDVRVVNLSLLNTPWYIHQIKDQMGVPITKTREQIDALVPVRIQGYDRIWRVQDEMVKHIITNSQKNGWNPPVYFAMTVASENMLGLEDHLILEGMVHRVVDSSGLDRVNTDIGFKIFTDKLHFRSINDPGVFKDENDFRLISNYIAAMFQVVESYEKKGRPDSALIVAEAAINLRPPYHTWQAYAYLFKMYAFQGKFDRITPILGDMDSVYGEKACLAVTQDLLNKRDLKSAAELLRITLEKIPSSFPALNNLVVVFYENGDTASADSVVAAFRAKNNGNPALLRRVDDMLKRYAQPVPAPENITGIK